MIIGDFMSDNEDFDEFEEFDGQEEDKKRSPTLVSKIPSGSKITVYFRSTIGPGEKLEKMSVDPETPITELKVTLGNLFALDPQDFHLSIGGRTLDNEDILSNYELEDGIEALIIPVSTAGLFN